MRSSGDNDEITLTELSIYLKNWFSYLLSKWKIILLAGILGGSAGFLLASLKKPVYTAALTFVIDDPQSGNLSGAAGIANMLGFDLGNGGGSIFSSANLIELFRSRMVIEQTLLTAVSAGGKSASFADMYMQLSGLDKKQQDGSLQPINFSPNADRNNFSRAQDSLLGVMYESIIQNNLKVEQKDKRVDIISIEMQTENENFTKYFVEALATQVSDFYIETKSRKARINMDILEKQTDSVRSQLNASINGVAKATDNTFGLNPAFSTPRVPSTQKQVDVQANSAILTELVKQTELAKVMVRKSTPLIQVIDRPIFPLKKQKASRLKNLIIGSLIGGILIVVILMIARSLKRAK